MVNPDPRGFYLNEQGVVAPYQTVFNGGKRRKNTRRANRKNRRGTRRQKGGGTMKISYAILKLREIQREHGNLDFYRRRNEFGKSDLVDIRKIYFDNDGGWKKAVLESVD
jgi:hypothetical protein